MATTLPVNVREGASFTNGRRWHIRCGASMVGLLQGRRAAKVENMDCLIVCPVND